MLKKTLIMSALMIIILALAIALTYNARTILFHSIPWLIAAVIVLGVTLGITRGIKQNNFAERLSCQSDRHTIDSFLEHWGVAVGVLILIISGLLLVANYIRGFSTNLHFLGLVITLCFGTYFLAHFFVSKKYAYLLPSIRDIIDGTVKKYLLRAPWKESSKYLSSQKSAFLVFSLLGTGIILTGAIKVVHYYFGVPGQLIYISTRTHDYLGHLFVVVLVIHILLVLAIGSHRHLLASLFTGKVK